MMTGVCASLWTRNGDPFLGPQVVVMETRVWILCAHKASLLGRAFVCSVFSPGCRGPLCLGVLQAGFVGYSILSWASTQNLN